MHVSPHESVAVAIAVVAAMVDLRSRRIPNVLTFGAAAAARIVAGMMSGPSALAMSGGGWLLGLALWLPIYALGGMGAGDVKLLAALGAWLGPAAVLYVALYAAVAGGLLGVAVAAGHGRLRRTCDNITLLMTHWRVAGFTPHAQLTLATSDSPRLAYAVPILAGTLVHLWLR